MSAFDQPEVVLPKVTLTDIVEMCRTRINCNYMPSAYGKVQYNTKPDYYSHELPDHPNVPDVARNDWTGYYAMDSLATSNPIYVLINLGVEGIQILICLKTLQALIRTPDTEFEVWESDSKDGISVNPYLLQEHLDTYL